MKVLVALVILVGTAYANSGGHSGGSGAAPAPHHSSVADLIWPAFNFVILASFLVWKVKGPLRDMFEKNANEVKYIFEHAEKADKEATIKLDALKKKMASLDSERSKIAQSAEREADDFIQKAQRESEEYIKRLKADSENKLEYEKTTRVAKLEENLIDEVISKAKNKIGSSTDLSDKVSKKLVSQIK